MDNDLKFNECFSWCHDWKNCPVEVINDIQSIYFQIIPTLTFQKYRGQANVNSTECRLCHNGIVQHLLSSCEYFLQFYYSRRHNNALKYIYFNILVKYGIIPKCPPWYSKNEIKPWYENDEICILWDIPEYLGFDDEDDSKLLRPDGKLIFKTTRKVMLLEMSVPWIQNRERKFAEKEEKYRELVLSMKTLYADYEIKQVTFIMDCLGGYSSSCIEALKDIGFSKYEYERILRNMQKVVITESRYIINKFKQLTSK